jgi:hypothetical protein
MADAYVIETAGETAGIVVLEKRGVRFYASEAIYYPLDGKTFPSLSAIHRAVDQIRIADPHASRRAPLRSAA